MREMKNKLKLNLDQVSRNLNVTKINTSITESDYEDPLDVFLENTIYSEEDEDIENE